MAVTVLPVSAGIVKAPIPGPDIGAASVPATVSLSPDCAYGTIIGDAGVPVIFNMLSGPTEPR